VLSSAFSVQSFFVLPPFSTFWSIYGGSILTDIVGAGHFSSLRKQHPVGPERGRFGI
jgi:hypothetical protein